MLFANLKPLALLALTATVGCGTPTAEQLAPVNGAWSFSAEQAALPDFSYDSGYLPEASPLQLRVNLASIGKMTITATGEPLGEDLAGVADSGHLEIDGGISVKLSVKADLGAIQFEGPLEGAPNLDINFQNFARFTPFLVGDSVDLTTDVPTTKLATIPLAAAMGIPAVKGDLIINAGGTLNTKLIGLCATVKDGVAHYVAETTTSGTVNIRPTLEISALMINKVVGPFDIPVAIPAIKSRIDLGAIDHMGQPSDFKPCDQVDNDNPFVDAAPSDSAPSDSNTDDPNPDTSGPDSSPPDSTPPAEDTREPEPCPLGTLDNCLSCGDVCLGQGLVGTEPTCEATGCAMRCTGDSYDINGDPTDGCEAMDDQKSNHTQLTAHDMGSVTDCAKLQTAGGSLPSDEMKHVSLPYARKAGLEDWFALQIEDKPGCVMEGIINFDLTALPAAAVYEADAVYVCDADGTEIESKLWTSMGGEKFKISMIPLDCPTPSETGTLYVRLAKVSGPHSVASYSISIKP